MNIVCVFSVFVLFFVTEKMILWSFSFEERPNQLILSHFCFIKSISTTCEFVSLRIFFLSKPFSLRFMFSSLCTWNGTQYFFYFLDCLLFCIEKRFFTCLLLFLVFQSNIFLLFLAVISKKKSVRLFFDYSKCVRFSLCLFVLSRLFERICFLFVVLLCARRLPIRF